MFVYIQFTACRRRLTIKIKSFLKKPYNVYVVVQIIFISFAFLIDSPEQILNGLATIIKSRDVLITDYVEIAGIGATLINVSITSLISASILIMNKVKYEGSTISALWLVIGFSFFGKTFVNVWPIYAGGFLYAKFKKKPFSQYAAITILATSLSPVVSQLTLEPSIHMPFSAILGISVGTLIGFVMPSVASNCMKFNSGHNLYNAGFSAGIIGIAFNASLKSFGVDIIPTLIWNKTSTLPLSIMLCTLFLFLIAVGLICGENNKQNLKAIYSHSGKLTTDYYSAYKETAYINMGMLGLIGVFAVLLVGDYINGPTVGAICVVAGFGAFGKHAKNAVPIMAGCILGGFLATSGQGSPSITLAVLFGTCLAPIAGEFGWIFGILAGFLHVNIVVLLAPLHGGLNLYNNGLAGGLVCIFLVPVIYSFAK